MILFQETGDEKYFAAAKDANSYVRRTMDIHGQEGIDGGIQGSFPVHVGYAPYRYLNWAAKFFIDSNLMEQSLTNSSI